MEFEDKLVEAEEEAKRELDEQKQDLTEKHQAQIDQLNNDLERHKAAIAKLSDKLTIAQE